MIQYFVLGLLLMAVIFMIYLYLNQEKLETKIEVSQTKTNAALARQSEYLQGVKAAMAEEIYNYKKITPVVQVNTKNEAQIFMPDGKTEIYNYDLKKKK